MTAKLTTKANTLPTHKLITREALFRLWDMTVFPHLCSSTQICSSAKKNVIDNIINLKKKHFCIQVNEEKGIPDDIVSFGELYLRCGAEKLARTFDAECGKELLPKLHTLATTDNGVGNPLTPELVFQARKVAISTGVLMNCAVFHPQDLRCIINNLKPVDTMPGHQMIPEFIRYRCKGVLNGWRFFECRDIPDQEVAIPNTGSVPLIKGAGQKGDTLVTYGWGAGDRQVQLKKGQLITIDGVYEIQPYGDKQGANRLKTFTVMEDVVTGTGHGTDTEVRIKISPEIIASDSVPRTLKGNGVRVSFENVYATPADNAAINILGIPGKAYRQGIFLEQSCMQVVNGKPKLSSIAPIAENASDPETGLSVSMHAKFDICAYEEKQRFDILFGARCARPERALRCWLNSTLN